MMGENDKANYRRRERKMKRLDFNEFYFSSKASENINCFFEWL